MKIKNDRDFGAMIMRLINSENLTREESRDAFYRILNNETTDLQQGALLAALTAKGETEDEVAGAWEAIYHLDTMKVDLNGHALVENCGTGMDSYKTYNISTAASLIAAAGGVKMARHGARAITSMCGTVDLAEALGVDVECSVDKVADSIKTAGIGLFNGMSPKTHPMALGRILSQIHFGSTLNIAASLANPVMPKRAVRGVYSKEMVVPVVKVMKAIGYERAVVIYGGIEGSEQGMDEASVCGITHCAELNDSGTIKEYSFRPNDFGFDISPPETLSPEDSLEKEAGKFVSLIKGEDRETRKQAAALNAGLIFYVADKVKSIEDGVSMASQKLDRGEAYQTLNAWVAAQN